MSAGKCLGGNTLVEFLRGKLPEADCLAVDAHADVCDDCRVLLLELARRESGACQALPSQEKLRLATQVGRYLILSQLGEGAMGVVYAAYDPELDRRVAIKLLRWRNEAQPLDAERLWRQSHAFHRTRLLREARALARLSHPNVVGIHDVGTFEGELFIAMDLVEGQTLRRWLEEKPRSSKEILGVFAQAGDGLAAAHVQGLVHRDFKPDNVLVGSDGRIRVTDFGLARVEETRPDVHLPKAPGAEALIGTPAYMAPEQLAEGSATAKSDQYSFCVCLFEALYGERPSPKIPLAAPARKGRITPHAHRALLKGLSAKPSSRFDSMKELLHALQKKPLLGLRNVSIVAAVLLFLAASTVLSHRAGRRQQLFCTGAQEKLAPFWNGQRRSTIQAAFAATNLPYAKTSFEMAASTLDDYAKGWASMHKQACEATRIRGEQSEEMLDRRMSCLQRRLKELDAVSAVLEKASPKLVQGAGQILSGLTSLQGCANLQSLRSTASLPTDSALRSKIEEGQKALAKAKALRSAGQLTESMEIARRELQKSEALKYPPLQIEALSRLGDAQRSSGSFTEAAESLTRGVLLAESTGEEESVAWLSAELLGLHARRSKFAEALFWEQHARAALQRTGSNEELQNHLTCLVGLLFMMKGDYQQAIGDFQTCLEFSQRHLSNPVWIRWAASSHVDLGQIFGLLGRTSEAESHLKQALAMIETRFGGGHPTAGEALLSLAWLYWGKRNTEASLRATKQAQQILEATDSRDFYFGQILSTLTRSYSYLGKRKEAIRLSRRAIETTEKRFGANYITLADSYSAYGDVLADSRRYSLALKQHQRALALLSQEQNSLDRAAVLTGLGRDWLGLGRARKALTLLEQAVGINRLPLADQAEAEFYLAQALWQGGGKRERAVQLAQEARRKWTSIVGPSPKLGEMDRWIRLRTSYASRQRGPQTKPISLRDRASTAAY